jgi:hypothetical protein
MGCEIEFVPRVFGFEADWDMGAPGGAKIAAEAALSRRCYSARHD